MIRASDENDTLTTLAGLERPGLAGSWTAAAFAWIRKTLHAVEDAHQSRCNLSSFAAEEFEDTGVDPSDATGITSWQPDLPFFMQSGFGRK
jgi:hypothetical protein